MRQLQGKTKRGRRRPNASRQEKKSLSALNGSAPSIRGGGQPFVHCAILGIFGLLTYYTGGRLTDTCVSHRLWLCDSAESDLITPWVWWVFLPLRDSRFSSMRLGFPAQACDLSVLGLLSMRTSPLSVIIVQHLVCLLSRLFSKFFKIFFSRFLLPSTEELRI